MEFIKYEEARFARYEENRVQLEKDEAIHSYLSDVKAKAKRGHRR